MNIERKFITLKEAAEYLAVTRKKLYGMLDRGVFTKYKPAGKIYIKIEELERYMTKIKK